MKNKIFILIGVLLLLMSLPHSAIERMRGGAMVLLAPAFEQLGGIGWVFHQASNFASLKELQRLQLENQLLYAEIERIQELTQHELFLKEIDQNSVHTREVKKYLSLQMQALPARVIFRSPNTWNSSFWINVGRADNKRLEQPVIAKNSPVMLGMSIIGAIDYVGERQCRVRLITDAGLNPSVRVSRGGNTEAIRAINELLRLIQDEELIDLLRLYKKEYLDVSESAYLAKGELCGSSHPLWRSEGQVLKGTGFNYDYSDSEGVSRDLRTGLPKGAPNNRAPVPLITVGDLLITTGLDGVFPKGFQVARVIGVSPLKEGDYFYDIEAVPTAGNLNEVDMVMVLPPVGFDISDRPPY